MRKPRDRKDQRSFTSETKIRDALSEALERCLPPEARYDRSVRLTSATETVIRLIPVFAGLEVEEFHVLLLDARHALKRREMISRGSLTGVEAHPRDVLVPAVRHRAAGVILAHNHPSGVPDPSAQDIAITERIVSAGEILGIAVLDHIIVGANGSFYSFAEHGRIRSQTVT